MFASHESRKQSVAAGAESAKTGSRAGSRRLGTAQRSQSSASELDLLLLFHLALSPCLTMFPTQRLFAVVSQPFKRAQLGLFQGKTRQTGNSIPFSKHKTRRSWLPNVQSKRYFSDALQQWMKVKVTTRAIKTIKKVRASRRSRVEQSDWGG